MISDAKIKADELFSELRQFVEADASQWRFIDARYLWRIVGDTASRNWLLDFSTQSRVVELAGAKPERVDCQVASSSDDLEAILSGQLTLQQAFAEGRIKLAGDEEAALRLQLVVEIWRQTRERSSGMRLALGSKSVTIH